MATTSVQELLKAGVHYGHRTSRWNPRMEPFLFGRRNGIHIINLKATLRGLIQAQRFLGAVARSGEPVLFVGTKRAAAAVIREEVAPRGLAYVVERWLGGMLTNFETIRRSLGRLEQLEAIEQTDQYKAYSKKMVSMHQREKRKILRNLQGVRNLTRLPAAVVIVDPRREKIAVLEALKLGIATVGLLDTDCDPSQVSIPVPCNDDAIRSLQLILRPLIEAIEEGRADRTAEAPVQESPPPSTGREPTASATPQA